jgi:4-hydroxy-tetrahydrodipicolinate reductase
VTRVAICGIRGRMGQTLLRLARERGDMEVAGGIDRLDDAKPGTQDALRIVSIANCAQVLGDSDVLIDFSAAAATRELLEHAAGPLNGRALVVGTTGLDAATEEALDELSRTAAVLTAANFSLGVNLLLGLTTRVAAALDAESFDIEIVEAHHRRKTDAPSGTALALAEAAARGREESLSDLRRDGRSGDTGERPVGEIGLHAVRGGGVTGEHRVLFLGERERVELAHEALDRSVFGEGALHAARWLHGRRPGRYTMQHVLGF